MSHILQKILITGDKVQLRPIRATDAHLAYSMVKDEEILKWLIWDGPKDEQEIITTYKKWETEFGTERDSRFAIEQINVPGIIGCIGLNHHNDPEKAELGYWLAAKYWGNSYMSDATRLICYLGFKYLDLVKIYSPVFIGNARSKRVLKKNGFSSEGILRSHFKKRGEWRDVWYMSLLKLEWEKNQDFFLPKHESIKIRPQ